MAGDRDRDMQKRGLEDRIEGAGKEAQGKVRNAVGDLTDDRSEQLKGKGKELEGKAQRKLGEAEEDIDRERRTP
jgi:uncharacterized protein YjbJ (UPF0337 family)